MADVAALIRRIQSRFVRSAEPHRVFDDALPDLLDLSGSEYGFIGEVWRDAGGAPYLKIFTLTNIAWDEATREAIERQRIEGIEFRNLKTLFGAALVTGETVIANDAPNDPRASRGMPIGHRPLNTFLGVPLHYGGELVGMIGLANRSPGYDEHVIRRLEPLSQAMAGIIAAVQLDRERRRAEEALRESQRRFIDTFVHAPIGIAHTGLDGRLIDVNRQFAQIVGHDISALIGRHFRDITHPDDTTPNLDHFHALLRGDIEVYEQEKRYIRPDGSFVWAQLTATVARRPDGQPDHLITVVNDISDRHAAQEARIAAATAERANAAKTEFLSRMSHELRTPLNAVLGFAQLLRRDMSPALAPAQRDRVRHIEHAGQHLLAVISDVLDLSRIEAGTLPLSPRAIHVHALLKEALALVAPAAQTAGVAISIEPPEDALQAHADPIRVRQVLVNLLSNAVKYNRHEGRVTVSARVAGEQGEQVAISVLDTGHGLSPHAQSQLFEPFNRLGADREGIEGVGLGLAIAKRLSTLMQGDIHVHSESGVGSRFTVVLPALPAGEARADGLVTTSSMPLDPPPPRQRSVLYAEDNPLNVELLKQALWLRGGWEVRIATSGEEAIAMARAAPPDVLLLDMHLGDMSGLEVAAALRDDAALRHVPRIALSADAMADHVSEARAQGFDDYLTKPFDLNALWACLERHAG
jgi:PAS domain S-box-containing protein